MDEQKKNPQPNMAVHPPQPQGEVLAQAPTQAPTQSTELEIRAQKEMETLKATAQKKQMIAQSKPKIGAEEVRKASEILRKYKQGKARLEQKIIANEEFWKLRQ